MEIDDGRLRINTEMMVVLSLIYCFSPPPPFSFSLFVSFCLYFFSHYLSLSLPQFLTSFVSLLLSDANVNAFSGNVTQFQTHQDFTGLLVIIAAPKKDCISRGFSLKLRCNLFCSETPSTITQLVLVTIYVQLPVIILVHNKWICSMHWNIKTAMMK